MLLLIARIGAACAGSYTWTGAGTSANWDSVTAGFPVYDNWTPVILVAPPGAADDVTFGSGFASGNPNLNGSRTVKNLVINSAQSFSLVGNPGDTLTLASGNVTQTGITGSASINVPVLLEADGAWTADSTLTLNGPVSDAGLGHGISIVRSHQLVFAGAGSQLSYLNVPFGDVTLSGGSLALNSQSGGLTTTEALSVGIAAMSTGNAVAPQVVVEGGATLDTSPATAATISGGLPLGFIQTVAQFTIDGVSTKWLLPTNTYIGESGYGQVTIQNGATVTGGAGTTIFAGALSKGTLLISSAAKVTSGAGFIGATANTGSTATVTGTGSSWSTGAMSIGAAAGPGGELDIASGGTVSVSGATTVYNGAVLSVDHGSFTTGSLTNGNTGGTINLVANPAGGTALTINADTGSGAFSGAISGAGGVLKTGRSTQAFSGTNIYSGTTTINGGTLSIAVSGALPLGGTVANYAALNINANSTAGGVTGSGTTTIAGGVTLAATSFSQGGITMQIAGSAPALNAKLGVSGTLTLGGTLTVNLLHDFTPSAGQSFDLLDWGTLSGKFSSLQLPTLGNTLGWDATQLYKSGVLSVITISSQGDYNHDGVVDAADYVAWREGLGTTYTQTDYDVWRVNFGNTAASGNGSRFASGQSAVPEPGTPLLVLVGLFNGLIFGRTSRQR